MYLVIVGVLLLAAKLADFGPTAAWSWWVIALPFVVAVLWWHFADASGWTKRRAMNRMEERKAQRRERAIQSLGLDTARDKRASVTRAEVARRAAAGATQTRSADPTAQVEGQRRSQDPTL
jgi:small Trp-rich protein